jgi:hypothetical protein
MGMSFYTPMTTEFTTSIKAQALAVLCSYTSLQMKDHDEENS